MASRERGREEWERGLDERERGVDAWSAVWTVVSADGALGGFQVAFQRLERRRVRVQRYAEGAGHPGERAARRECGPGEVSVQQLTDAIATTNSNGVVTLGMTVSDPPMQAEVQAIAPKLDELITALRR